MTTAIDLYTRGLAGERVWVEAGPEITELPVRTWAEHEIPGDAALLDRCLGPTLDVGCGPGRLTVALLTRGVLALGIDVCQAAVAMARGRGAAVLRRDVYGPVPREGSWRHVVLADGNIGIEGDPVRLLSRCRSLLTVGGSVLLDLQGAGGSLRTDEVRLRTGNHTSDWFRWSSVPTGALPPIAAASGFEVEAMWQNAGRWQAKLRTTNYWPESRHAPR